MVKFLVAQTPKSKTRYRARAALSDSLLDLGNSSFKYDQHVSVTAGSIKQSDVGGLLKVGSDGFSFDEAWLLDIGCGCGYMAASAVDSGRFSKVDGVEVCRNRFELCEQLFNTPASRRMLLEKSVTSKFFCNEFLTFAREARDSFAYTHLFMYDTAFTIEFLDDFLLFLSSNASVRVLICSEVYKKRRDAVKLLGFDFKFAKKCSTQAGISSVMFYVLARS